MAVGTITQVAADSQGQKLGPALGALRLRINTVVGPASYTTGGDALSAEDLGFGPTGTVVFAHCEVVATGTSHCTADRATYNVATGKLQFWASLTPSSPDGTKINANKELASTTNVSDLTVRVVSFGY